MSDVKLTGITKSFGAVSVLHGVDLEIRSGEFVVFVGPSGCGKSTLLRLIAGLEDATSGTIAIGGTVVNALPPAKRGIAMVFQSYALYPHMTVYDNMAFGLQLAKASKDDIHKRVLEAAEMLQLTPLLKRLPKQLSGGQRQRVAIGRAITRDPQVFLFDEPLSNLDAALRVATRIEIARLKDSMPNTTMIYVTHDQVEAMTLADRIVVLNSGRIEQVGTPLELYHRPANRFVASFIGSPAMNLLGLAGQGQTSRLSTIAARARAAGADTLGIRPEDLHPTTGDDALFEGRVSLVEHLGEVSMIYVDTGAGGTLMAKVPGDAQVAKGSAIRLAADQTHIHAFAPNGTTLRLG
jgi:ABC-type sugar transport system ATPase subunit